ncbi:MAG TPA: trimeric intracellular cation channel family protein [Aliidongia sp.]|nr:trimeric intracellular cation channel family protein [Aliidongia sp.]
MGPGFRIVRIADLGGTFVFAVQGALAAMVADLDPVGVLVLASLTAIGGGMIRDLLIGARPVAAVGDWHYSVIVIVAASLTWLLRPLIQAVPPWLLTDLDAAGLSLFAVAGTQKALDYHIHPLTASLLGTVSAVGGGILRDVALNQVPKVLNTDIYATAAMAAAVLVVVGRSFRLPARPTDLVAGLTCFAIRLAAVELHWQLPKQLY